MPFVRHVSALLALLLTAGGATADDAAGEWLSYRDAYRAMVVFEKYGRPKNFLQNHLQVMLKEKGVLGTGLQLSLLSKASSLSLPLDPTGRAVFPLLKAAYDDNATLTLTSNVSQYVFRARVSIVVRSDGVYETSDLRAACEQALIYLRHVDSSARTKRCSGVRLSYQRKGTDPVVRLRNGSGDVALLAVADGATFGDDNNDGFRVVNYRFGDHADKGQLVTQSAPLVIAPLLE
ncbi:hypothetical protein F2P45_10460 [Massilia sp. CCM 8733]|uniref:Uncharacterized protein n=1 Tax=Massilia mucilaginosa TaxID=2609282 RepID=A0ABX0NRA6_9BURK|nr:hypothetical protein [Massilia mucilaginosa]NHZ89433.1 hypothetical protein [Massilia mucilaginosa]